MRLWNTCLLVALAASGGAQEPVMRITFDPPPRGLTLHEGLKIIRHDRATCLEFVTPSQYATLPLGHALNGVDSAAISAWVYPRRAGEQYFFARGEPTTGTLGERFFPPQKTYVNFLLGADSHGFLLGALNGNGKMPFPYVTLNELPIDAWSHLVLTKDKAGFARFYINGTLVASDLESAYAPLIRPFIDTADDAPPLRIQMPLGGLIGECAVFARALSEDQIRDEFARGAVTYRPALAAKPVALREMDRHPRPDLWNVPGTLTAQDWARERSRILASLPKVLGTPPSDVRAYYEKRDAIKNNDFTLVSADLEPKTISEEDCATYTRRKVRLQVQPDDVMYAWLLIPKKPLAKTSPAVICFYGTTSGAGKDTTVGLSGSKPGTPPDKNRAFAIDFVNAGFVVLAPDYLRDGQRIATGDRPYDTTRFYKKFPDWSIHAKDAYDTSRAIDYLQSLDFVNPTKIAMTGHSYGGHSTLFATALEPRIKAAAASGPVSDFLHHGLHWAVPKGAANSQSMPLLRPYILPYFPHLALRDELSTQDSALRTLPLTFYEFAALIAPRPLLVFQAVGERRPNEEENASAVTQVYDALSASDKVHYLWHPGNHDYPPQARRAALEWFKRHLGFND